MHNPEPWNDEPDRSLDLNKTESRYVKMALEFAAEHPDGWKGREVHEAKMLEIAERAAEVRL